MERSALLPQRAAPQTHTRAYAHRRTPAPARATGHHGGTTHARVGPSIHIRRTNQPARGYPRPASGGTMVLPQSTHSTSQNALAVLLMLNTPLTRAVDPAGVCARASAHPNPNHVHTYLYPTPYQSRPRRAGAERTRADHDRARSV
ncbi:hypothetical protein HYPSUDRAFT_218187 [Hypholoma sublateritium FD-334 SS-4]|uniref:Uncharacterized protein n=1 Tax=Hypholoma sublateritium (strain FD-334 SS-4) TaxID=945553 RepID=A0A0D2M5R2_HYPSF|nr:hypothetical protein HYPSUDRAFT_218187 [Hypholoma sublateritium FD-334 SS-4]